VQGFRGERRRYRDVDSLLVARPDPSEVAQALCRACDSRAVYVADLDAIAGRGSHGDQIRELRDHLSLAPWVDAGTADAAQASRLLDTGAARVIVGTETLSDLRELRAIRATVPSGRLLVSVDLDAHGVISRCAELSRRTALGALDLLVAEGATEVILLSLPQVGTGAGPDLETLAAARASFSGLRLISGGGVHGPDDLRRLAEAGADGVLLATALHRGWISPADIRAVRGSHGALTSEP